MKRFLTALPIICFIFTASAQTSKKPSASPSKHPVVHAAAKNKERLVELITDYGNMTIKLYDSTPLHRDNFIKLIKQGFYDSLLFHRIMQGFMIQGGDPESKYADGTVMLGAGQAPGGRIPAEFKPYLIHKKGCVGHGTG